MIVHIEDELTILKRYIDFHLSLFPIKPESKAPWLEHNPSNAEPASFDQVVSWRDEKPGCNWGIHCGDISNLVVVDVDQWTKAENDFIYSYEWNTAIAKTRRGFHYYYILPSELKGLRWKDLRTSSLKLQMEIRANGSYVLCPPSWWVDGDLKGQYAFIRPLDEIQPLPPGLIAKLKELNMFELSQDREFEIHPQLPPLLYSGKPLLCVERAWREDWPDTTRHNYTWTFAAMLKHNNVKDDWIYKCIEAKNQTLTKPQEVKKLRNSIKYGLNYPKMGCQGIKNHSPWRDEECKECPKEKKRLERTVDDKFSRLNRAARDSTLERSDFKVLYLVEQQGTLNISALAREANISNRVTVRESLKRLREKGYLLEPDSF